ncbi:hypothetical protein SASPL_135517 [Salvia splendens]|uniref:Endoplasmic reticulum transmembrane protein n=1 Tax=Salvia splendens TaxID=180675 RepID=A0A8X8WYB8_SALSN|nr:hypothetical protein SASPL_135517 [Salvia splendens]
MALWRDTRNALRTTLAEWSLDLELALAMQKEKLPRPCIFSPRPSQMIPGLGARFGYHEIVEDDESMGNWIDVLGYSAAAEAIMLLFLTLPGLDPIRKGLITVTQGLLKPFLSIVPFCLFLLMDIYWKYETRPTCESDSCSPSEHLRHQKSIMKSQRNALLIASALIFYWLLYSVTLLVVKIDRLKNRIEKHA